MLKNFLLLCLFALLVACAQIQTQERLKEYQTTLDPLVGQATQEDIVRQFGPPQERKTYGALEIWTYHQSFGMRGGAYVSPYNQYGTYASTRAHEVYDRVTLTFNSAGRLDSWRAYVQR